VSTTESTSPDLIVAQVDALLARRRTDHARTLLKEALTAHPNHTGLLLQAAWADYFDDRHDEALRGVRQVLAAEPHDLPARLLYFELMIQTRNYVEAERTIIDVLRDCPEEAHCYGRYASLMLDTLKLAKARQLAEEGLKYDADDPECLAAITICDFIEQRKGARSVGLERMLANNPESLRTLALVIVALQERGKLREARRLSQELVRAQPDNSGIAEMARQLKIATHWSLIPLWPMQRFGWGGSVGLWVLAVIGIRAAGSASTGLGGVLAAVFFVYVVYSWTWPPLLKRLIKP